LWDIYLDPHPWFLTLSAAAETMDDQLKVVAEGTDAGSAH
jgi:hypothetical protein